MGLLTATRGAADALARHDESYFAYVQRHHTGDWGDVGEDDRNANAVGVREGYRIFSVYSLQDGKKLWVITEADRSVTTLLLPSEY
nr:hypothetical protein [Cupriavidus basilensis]